jgi:endonuclease/exonuclease/phosphatase family metal-dependent hydrolase
MAPDVRMVTFNAAAGNPHITTPQEAFLELPFYREALAGGAAAPLLALQEVGGRQARALRRAVGAATVLQRRRPGLGNALVIPDRYAVLAHRSGYYVLPHLRAIARGGRDWRQNGELRMWIRARLRDREAGRELTLITTHVSFDRALNAAQLDAVARRARVVGPPVLLAGDVNAARLPAGLRDMGTTREKIDYVLAAGFEPVSARAWTDLVAAGISDHAAEDVVVRYTRS